MPDTQGKHKVFERNNLAIDRYAFENALHLLICEPQLALVVRYSTHVLLRKLSAFLAVKEREDAINFFVSVSSVEVVGGIVHELLTNCEEGHHEHHFSHSPPPENQRQAQALFTSPKLVNYNKFEVIHNLINQIFSMSNVSALAFNKF